MHTQKTVGDNENRRIAAHHGSSSPQRPEGCADMRFQTFKWLDLIRFNFFTFFPIGFIFQVLTRTAVRFRIVT
jgi:hypothetical protein